MERNRGMLAAVLGAVMIGTGGAVGAAQGASPVAAGEPLEVVLRDAGGNDVGVARFVQESAGGLVTVDVRVEGAAPGDHGIHVHEYGACDPGGDQPFASAGGHDNPTASHHGGPPAADEAHMAAMAGTPEGVTDVASPEAEAETAHAGDLGNITVGEDGTGSLSVQTSRFTLESGDMSLADDDGSAIVLHAEADDLVTDPSGNSGGRIACGVVFAGAVGTPVASPAAS